ncbi:respiratory nitrate reductase 1 subunit alpha [Escherichia coli]|uniref:Respiratory nitrate reductase 1 subunit alpha n=1 Tax=Escherichia coli TaxID=562 RepID=A0A377BFM6_ECOLX|nr:respiratory nitrate reductase 1 subunit alpha [Escherichia coli]
MEKIGNGGKGIAWNTQSEMDLLRKLNYTKAEGPAKGQPMLNTAIDAAEMILTLAPETNGQVAVKAWAALSEFTGRDHTHLALNKEDEKIRFRDIQAQPRKIISSPTWSGLEDEHVSYNAGYTNVHELIPWRTLSGRQQLYQDHQWMRDFGESLLVYRPPDRHPFGERSDRPEIQRQPGKSAQLPDAAPEVGYPLHLQRQPADADFRSRWSGGLVE